MQVKGVPGKGTSMSKDTEAENPVWKQAQAVLKEHSVMSSGAQAVLKEHSVMSSGCLGWGKGGGKGG